MAELDERLELAVSIALEASAIPRRHFNNEGLVVDRKSDDSPVTRADRDTEVLLRERIEAACPNDAIVGEEFPSKDGTTGFKWYLDPIDGTESFVRGVPLFGTMVALVQDDDAVMGVIAFPALGEIVYAAKGSGAWWATNAFDAKRIADLDRRAARVSKTAGLAEAALSTSGMELYPLPEMNDGFERLLAKTKLSRGWSDCYGHYLVATGRIDVMVDPVMHVWDNAPLLPIVVEAGGRFTDLSGNAVIDSGSGLSTNGLLHDAVLREWRG
jgi:histidinol phosphatase-like enzyme (inositol monophosphatase family)